GAQERVDTFFDATIVGVSPHRVDDLQDDVVVLPVVARGQVLRGGEPGRRAAIRSDRLHCTPPASSSMTLNARASTYAAGSQAWLSLPHPTPQLFRARNAISPLIVAMPTMTTAWSRRSLPPSSVTICELRAGA